ncbi:MAG TPA: metal-binding protein [Coriobacteriia bacterium]|nr:metal-binding protein [Coriobacteriia bacterium]
MDICEIICSCGFSAVGRFDAGSLDSREEVRDMCAADKCAAYNRSWSCPPACGDLNHFQALLRRYKTGHVIQTVVLMEDPFDYEAIEAGMREHVDRTRVLFDRLIASGKPAAIWARSEEESPLPEGSEGEFLLLGAGACTICVSCTYPDAPCIFPEKVYPSMEAAGLLVSDVCDRAEVPYYHGPGTIAFCSCVLE